MSKESASDRKLVANGANARKATAPRTAEGKTRASLNAVQYGLLAEHTRLRSAEPASASEPSGPTPITSEDAPAAPAPVPTQNAFNETKPPNAGS